MPRYLLHHRHPPRECGAVFASFTGHDSPLRHTPTTASCLFGGHEIWWQVTADSKQSALAPLPFYVAARPPAVPAADVETPCPPPTTSPGSSRSQGAAPMSPKPPTER